MAGSIEAIFSPADLEVRVASGHVRVRRHPIEPLLIGNYTSLAAFDSLWDDVTRNPRAHRPAATDAVWSVATRGAVNSDQALWATAWLRRVHPNLEVDRRSSPRRRTRTALRPATPSPTPRVWCSPGTAPASRRCLPRSSTPDTSSSTGSSSAPPSATSGGPAAVPEPFPSAVPCSTVEGHPVGRRWYSRRRVGAGPEAGRRFVVFSGVLVPAGSALCRRPDPRWETGGWRWGWSGVN